MGDITIRMEVRKDHSCGGIGDGTRETEDNSQLKKGKMKGGKSKTMRGNYLKCQQDGKKMK